MENLTKTDLIYQYRVHNDFIETTTETGIFGGLLFLSIFVFFIWPYISSLFKKEEGIQNLQLLFLTAFGLAAYTFDAFFNFPHDRPEIQVLFALFVGAGIALTQKKPGIPKYQAACLSLQRQLRQSRCKLQKERL